jgi:hypothetical protein
MGIDRHEFEHRNWRSSSPSSAKEIAPGIAGQLDTSIVPDDNRGRDEASMAAKRVKREKTDQLR